MATTKIVKGRKARKLLLEGVDDIAGPVGSTLGPLGQNVTIGTLVNGIYMPHVTKDGVTVARSIIPNFGDDFDVRAIGANSVKQAAIETARKAGDGTTTATVLAQAICHKGVELVEKGYNPHEVREGMEAAAAQVVAELKLHSSELSMLSGGIHAVARIASNGDEKVAALVAEAYEAVGKDGMVVMDRSKTNKTYVESVMGAQVAGGCSPMFFNDMKNLRCVHEDCNVFITTEIISKFSDLELIGNETSKAGRALVLVAEQVTGEALGFLTQNASQGRIRAVIINLADYGDRKQEVMDDICAVVGGYVHGRKSGKMASKTNPSLWGYCSKVEVYDERAVFIGGKGNPEVLASRISMLSSTIDSTEDDEKTEWMRRRIASLSGAISCIYVGAATDVEAQELYDRMDDAIRSVRCANDQGILPGGGHALYRIGLIMKMTPINQGSSYSAGFIGLIDCLSAPLQRICENAAPTNADSENKVFRFAASRNKSLYEDVKAAIHETASFWYGTNIKTGYCGDLREAGIVDPTLVTITALENAVSVAGGIMTTNHVVVNL